MMKQQIQKFGRTLSAMVMPNIGAFIAWGLIMALFVPGGWWPNADLYKIGEPMMRYLLPLLIAYTAGYNIYKIRGGVMGAIATIGVIVGSNIPMFVGAMIMGPLGGWFIKWFDSRIEGKVKAGFEMLVNNFSIGIFGMLLSLVGFLFIGNAVEWLTDIVKVAVEFLIAHKLLPLVALLVEPGKVMFLNNAINHGIFDVLGASQVEEAGKSILYLIETNPGPGLGILLACWAFGQGSTKESAPGAVIIHFFGGIHEIFFPYVLAQPMLLIATILGSASALLFYNIFGVGLVAPASPGSIIAVLAMAPRGETLMVLAGVLIAATVSFLVASPIVKLEKSKDTLENASVPVTKTFEGEIRKIIFACDAGMGSSALGATRFKSRMIKFNIMDVACSNSAADSIPSDADIVVCQQALSERIHSIVPDKELVVIGNFLSDPHLDQLLERLQSQLETRQKNLSSPHPDTVKSSILSITNILTNLKSESKEAAIRRAGEMLAASGYVEPGYIEAMLEREKLTTTYMGMGLAIPHGTSEAKDKVLHSGIVVLQYPDGVDFGDEKAHLVIGIAGVGNEHLDILAKISSSLEDESVLQRLFNTTNPADIYEVLK